MHVKLSQGRQQQNEKELVFVFLVFHAIRWLHLNLLLADLLPVGAEHSTAGLRLELHRKVKTLVKCSSTNKPIGGDYYILGFFCTKCGPFQQKDLGCFIPTKLNWLWA